MIADVVMFEDSRTCGTQVLNILRLAGLTVAWEYNADRWERTLDAINPRLIIMDIIMPGQDGYRVTRAIKRDPRFAGIPVLMFSSKTADVDFVWAIKCGACGFIPKPIRSHSEVLVPVFDALCNKNKVYDLILADSIQDDTKKYKTLFAGAANMLH